MENVTFKKSLILFVFMCGFLFSSFCQKAGNPKEFSKEFSVYTEELDRFMNNSNLREIVNLFFKLSADLTVLEKERVINISNKMLKKRLRANPHFSSFLSSLILVDNHKNGDKMLPEWLLVVDQIVENTTTKKLMLFCKFTDGLIKDNVLRSSKVTTWLINNDDYKFHFDENEPIIFFNKPFDLRCTIGTSSYIIEGTKGKYYSVSNNWSGKGGVISWENQGFSKDSVYAVISDYEIDTRKTAIIADSVMFYNKYIFSFPILGQLTNKLVSSRKSDDFPTFISYSKDVELNEIFANVDYKGGYKLKGKEFIADGGNFSEARVIFKRDGKSVFVANADRFVIKSDRIVSEEAGVKILFDNDSIFHSNLQFKYIDSERQLQLYRDVNGLSGAPMLNTYHNITMDFELLKWNIDEEIIKFGSLPGTAESKVIFESVDMYLQEKFESLQGIDAIHPLFLLNNYVKATKEEIIYVEDFARFARFPLLQIQHYLIQLSNHGFIFYDFTAERFTILPKLYNYVDAASDVGDYDVISFNSVISTGEYDTGDRYLVNSVLNLTTKDLNILGIYEIELSKEREVYLYPKDGLLVVKKNRDFIFNGHIFAGKGRLNLFGRGFFFHYDEFKVDLNYIDSVQLSVPIRPIQKDMYGNELLTTVKTVIEAVKGDLRIDSPTNKSGIRKDSFPNFPIFRSFEDSYAYYDRNSIHNGVYNRDRFSFHLDPFEIDSLDSYTSNGLWFAGSFQSADIFPIFKDTLRLQDDYSLGFIRSTPVDGFEIYRGKGRYNNDIHLSHQGLKGKGSIQYLTSTSASDEIFFFPDSTNLYTKLFSITEVEKGIEFPDVNNTEAYAHFEPYNDRLNIYKTNQEFKMYNNQFIFNGDLLVRPIGLTGGGTMLIDQAKISSDFFTYNANWFGADTASLQVFENGGALAFQANNLKSHIDVDMREGIFHSNGAGSYVEFPANQYIAYIDKLKWLMDDESLTLGEKMSSTIGSEFVSTHSLQDSLSFIAKSAFYSLKDYIIHANGVDDIGIADAIIYPDSGVITVAKNAVIETLYNATILADDLTEYHLFNNASVDIKSANNYIASGDYSYKKDTNDEKNIFFKEIAVNLDTITVAMADISEETILHLDSRFDFKGNIELIADQKELIFDGYFMTNHSCDVFKKEWVKFRSNIDSDNVAFILDDKIYNDNNELLSTAIVMSFDSTNFYSTFLSKKKSSALDVDLLSSSHTLKYDKETFSYIIGGPDTLSNYYILNEKDCSVRSEGLLDLNIDLGQIQTQSIASVLYKERPKITEIEGFLMLDFFFSEEALNIMAEDLYSAPGEELFDYNQAFAKNLGRVVGKKESEMLLVDLEMTDEYSKFPEKMKKSIVFAKTRLEWNRKNKAYIAKGPIAISNVLDKQVNATVDGYIIIEKGRKSDILTIYLQTELYDEYYFQYKDGVMKAWSTNPQFTIAINEVKESKRSLKKRKGIPSFRYMCAAENVTEKFLKEIKKKY